MARPTQRFLICVKNDGYDVSLEKRKIYIALPDEVAAKHRLVRIIDESGEDYLYPDEFFTPIDLPPAVRRAVMQAA
jgi:hypothetical protein